MGETAGPAQRSTPWRTAARLAACLVALTLAAFAATLAIGLDWRDPAWKGWLERELSRATGRPVALAGPLRLRVSSRPVLVAEDVRIGAPGEAGAGAPHVEERGHPAGDGIRIARVEVEAGLLRSLAARWPHIDRLAAEGIRWGAGTADPERIEFEVGHAEGRAPADGPAQLQGSGTVAGRAFRAELEGGPLAALLEAESPWPVAIFAEGAGASLRIAGELWRAGPEGGRALAGEFRFGLGAPDAQATARIFEAELPQLGPSALAGQLRVESGRIELGELVGSAGASHFEGELDIVPGLRPRIEGRITAAVLDMRPFLGQEVEPGREQVDAAGEAAPQTLVEWYRGLDDARLPLAVMRLADARIALAVDRWIGMPADVGAASADISLVDGRLDAPLRAHVAGVDLVGELHAGVDGADALHADLALGTSETPLGGLARWLLGLHDLRGALGGFSMRLVTGGATMREIVDRTELRMVAARGGLSYGHGQGERPVSFELGSFTMAGGAGEPLRIEANGSLLDQPVELGLVTDPPHRIVRSGTSSLAMSASSRSLRLAVDGRIAVGAVGATRDAAALELRFDAGDIRDLAPWLGTPIAEPMRLALAARLRGTRERWRIDPVAATLGAHRLAGMVARRGPEEGDGAALEVRIETPRIDIDELGRLFERASGEVGALALEIPVLPARVDLADLDLDVRIGEIARSALSIRELRFVTRIREGFMSASPLSLTALGVPLAGALEADLRTDVPAVNWWLAGGDVDVGELLRRLGFGDRIDARFDSLNLHLAARGSRLGHLLDASAMTAEVEGGHLRVRDPGTGGAAGFALTTGSIVAAPGEPLRAAVAGRAGDDPVAVSVQAARLRELVDADRRIPVAVDAVLGGARISLAGDVERPLGAGLRLGIEIAGDRIDGWSALTGVDLPRWGPYALAGDIVIDAAGYRIEGARVSVGGSSAGGDVRFDTSRSPPLLDLRLEAPVLALEDFEDPDWSPFADGGEPPDRAQAVDDSAPTLAGMGEQAARASDDLQRLLAADTLARFDARAAVDVGELRAADIRLGDARLRLSVDDGRLRIDPVAASIGAGELRLVLDYAPLASGAVDTSIELALDQVDYGLLARRIDPDTDTDGRIDARLEVRALTPTLSQAMRHGDGSLRFRLLPRRMRADVFDLWAGNLFIALVDRIDTDAGSTVNCAIGEFALADGVLEARRMLIDTTRVRVIGAGTVNFNDASLALRFDPWPKRAQFFSLATPIEVSGGFDDYAIGPRAGDVFMTGLRLLGSVLWVPVMKLAGARSPADGSDVCGDLGPAAPEAGEVVVTGRSPAAPADAPEGAPPQSPLPLAPVPLLDDPLFYGGP